MKVRNFLLLFTEVSVTILSDVTFCKVLRTLLRFSLQNLQTPKKLPK